MERYFIVFYNSQSTNGHLNGHMDFITKEGKYLPCMEAIARIKNEGLPNVVLTNIIELPEADFRVWTIGKKEIGF